MNSVLFLSDYTKIPCIIDWETTNKSFIHMAKVLKLMGVVNNTFMLVLTQPELQGVDPFSPDLTQEQMLKIGIEAKLNPWYLVRECMRIPAQGGDSVHFELNRANLAQLWCYLNSIDTFITIPRQIGKTYSAIIIADAIAHIWGTNVELGMFAKDNNLRIQNVRRFKMIRDGLPSYLYRTGKKYTTDNQESLEYKPNNTKYTTFVACPSRKTADTQGRGSSFVYTHWDEFAFYDNNDLSYPSAIAATDKAFLDARANGLPCANIITTTAGYTATASGKYAYDIKNAALRFDETIYDLTDTKALTELMCNSSTNNYMYIEYSYKQLGRDDTWFKLMTVNKPREVIERDYLNRWIHSSGESVIPKDIMDKLLANIAEPISVTITNGILINWYAYQKHLDQPQIKNLSFIIGSDSADNIGKDFTTLVIMDPRDMSVVGTCRCNQSNMMNVADLIIRLLERFPNAVFVPERNRAATLIDILIQRMTTDPKLKMDPMKRIFNYFVHDIDSSNSEGRRDYSLGSVRRQFGFKTTHSEDSRNLLYSKVLMTTIERNNTRIYDKIIIDEIAGLVVRNGRIDHKSSGNDDMLMGYLMACWFIMYGKNLHRYGINSKDILQISSEGELPPEDTGIMEILERVDFLEKSLKVKRNSPMILQAYTQELRELKDILEYKSIGQERQVSISLNQQTPQKTKLEALTPANIGNTLQLLRL